MPIYEYRCEECGHQFDALQKISEDPLTECPACSQHALKKLVSAPNFRLKGGGWYETDFKTDKDKKRNLADDGKSSGDKSSSADKPKSESKSKDSGTAKTAKTKSGDGGKAA
ncbi:MAG: zinc ribbon domain-containing protein [Pseudomonadota bacterium]